MLTPKNSMSTQGRQKLTNYRIDLTDMNKRLVFCAGLPSTGKTKQAIDCAIKEIREGFYDKLIIVRPVVIPKAGLLPGDLMEKMAPYTRQSNLYCQELNGQVTLEDMIEEGRAEVISADLLQGNRFARCYVIFDEVQNIPKSETFKILTRLGEGSKFVVIGDISRGQLARPSDKGNTMLDYCIDKFAGKDFAAVHYFYDNDDILGDPITKSIIIDLLEDFVF